MSAKNRNLLISLIAFVASFLLPAINYEAPKTTGWGVFLAVFKIAFTSPQGTFAQKLSDLQVSQGIFHFWNIFTLVAIGGFLPLAAISYATPRLEKWQPIFAAAILFPVTWWIQFLLIADAGAYVWFVSYLLLGTTIIWEYAKEQGIINAPSSYKSTPYYSPQSVVNPQSPFIPKVPQSGPSAQPLGSMPRQGATAQVADPANETMEIKLVRLQTLRDQGLISEAEFQTKKMAILDTL